MWMLPLDCSEGERPTQETSTGARHGGYHRGMARMIDIALSPDSRTLFDALADAGYGVALVGGAVRDALLARSVKDLDAVTDATTADVRASCEGTSWCRRVFAVGERYGTLGIVLADGATVEVSQVRDPSMPTFGDRYAADASHRDFTLNAIAAEWPGLALLDPVGGVADLYAGILRAPGDPAKRFAEDPLRVIRAARFVAELGFDVEPATRDAMPGAAPLLARVAAERIRDEFTGLLVAPRAVTALELLRTTGVLDVVLPEVAALDGLEQPTFHDLDALSHTLQAVGAVPASPVLRWAALLHDVGKPSARTVDPNGRIHFHRHARLGADLADQVAERLRFSHAERTAIVHLVREHMRLGELPVDNPRAVDRAVRRLDLWIPNADPPRRLVGAEDALELELADFAATAHRSEAPERRRVLSEAIAASRERGTRQPPAAPLDGRELMRELGLAEGPPVGAALHAVADAVAEGLLDAGDRAGALEIARDAVRRYRES